jgi:D-tagatose-1,6-bisphosphate aldolase subunit GatZ/KbaZ
MFRNLTQHPPPAALLSQYLPIAYAAAREGRIDSRPAALAIAHVSQVLDCYHTAASPAKGSTRG